MTRSEYIALYEKHLNGTATVEELDELLKYQDEFEMYIVSKDDNPADYEESKHRILAKLEDSTGHSKVKRIMPKTWWRPAAAAVFLLVAFGLYFLKKQTPIENNNNLVAAAHNIKPGTNKATLTLANGKTLVLTDALIGQLANEAGVKINKTKDGQIVYAAASENTSGLAVRYNILSTKRSEQFQVILPDGSHVWLDAESSLKYPVTFQGNQRVVELTGQGYFEVSHNAAMPFIVKTNRTDVQVLGTHFNVAAYDDDANAKTTLLEGSVRIRSNGAAALLKPGEQAVLDNNGHLTVNNSVDVNREVAWKNGLFDFKKAGIEEIMAKATRWYDIDVKYEGKVPPTKLTGRISRNVDISGLLGILQFEGIKLRVEGKSVIVSD